jgi:hypothetical protein
MPTWEEALLASGATQMIHLKNLMLSRPYLSRIPAQDMLLDLPEIPRVDNNQHFNAIRAAYPCATRYANGSYAMVYFPQAKQSLRVDLSCFSGKVKTWWFDPRNGRPHDAGEHPDETVTFTSPIAGPDWVLVLDAVSENFSNPGENA